MSKSIPTLIFERAAQIWSDPKARCTGVEKRVQRSHNDEDEVVTVIAYCAIGVLKQARDDIGVDGRHFQIRKLAKMLGYDNATHLMTSNDGYRYRNEFGDPRIQEKIFERLKEAAKGNYATEIRAPANH